MVFLGFGPSRVTLPRAIENLRDKDERKAKVYIFIVPDAPNLLLVSQENGLSARSLPHTDC
jgi:hypothetical protein